MKNLFYVFFLLFCFSCGSDDNGGGEYSTIDFTLLGKGNITGNGNGFMPQQMVSINSDASWDTFLNTLGNVQDVTELLNDTSVDFDNETAIAVIDETRENGLYDILLSISKNSENIKVEVITTQQNTNGTSGITQPYYIVKVDNANDLPVIFE